MMPNTYMHRYLFLSTLCILCLEGCSNTPQDPSTENDEGLAALAGPTIELTIEEGCNPLATTNECLFPLPSRFFEKRDSTSPTGVRWNFQDSNLALPDGTTPILFERYNRADGASPMMPILLHFGVDIDPAVLIPREKIALSTTKDSLVSLYDLETNEKVPFMLEMDSNLRETGEYDGRFALMIRPMRPMKMGHRHAVIIETGLKDISGKTIDSPPGFIALRDRRKTNSAVLESHRKAFEDLFTKAISYGHKREALFLAWDFSVASEEHVLGPIKSMREQALRYVEANGFNYTIESVKKDVNENVSRIIEGTFDTPCFLTDKNEIEFTSDNTPKLQGTCSYPFTMGIPEVANSKGNLRLTLLGHGLFGVGRSYITNSAARDRTHPLAQKVGSVVIATDWIGLSGGDRELLIREIVGDLNRITVVTDRLQQSLVNNLILIELILAKLQHDPALEVVHKPLLQTEKVGYYGISLGGIQGASITSIATRIDRSILAVAGGAWSTMLPRSLRYKPIKVFVDNLYPDPLSQAAFISFLQGMFDFTDPINLSIMLRKPDGTLRAKVIIQEAIGDCQVPNLNTEILSRQMGLTLLSPEVEDVYGLAKAETASHGALAQYLMPDRVEDYSPPSEAIVPQRDNGTHSKATFSDPAQEQIIRLLRDGQIEQSCEDNCDPD